MFRMYCSKRETSKLTTPLKTKYVSIKAKLIVITSAMARALAITEMSQFIMAAGLKICLKVKDQNSGLTDASTKVLGTKANLMAMVVLRTRLAQRMLVILSTVSKKVLARKLGLMAPSTRANGMTTALEKAK
jgi:hypothetical protein